MKDDCEDEFHLRLRDVFSQKNPGGMVSPVYMQTHAQAQRHRRMLSDGYK